MLRCPCHSVLCVQELARQLAAAWLQGQMSQLRGAARGVGLQPAQAHTRIMQARAAMLPCSCCARCDAVRMAAAHAICLQRRWRVCESVRSRQECSCEQAGQGAGVQSGVDHARLTGRRLKASCGCWARCGRAATRAGPLSAHAALQAFLKANPLAARAGTGATVVLAFPPGPVLPRAPAEEASPATAPQARVPSMRLHGSAPSRHLRGMLPLPCPPRHAPPARRCMAAWRMRERMC